MTERLSRILTKWPVLHEYRITAEDLDAGGVISDEAVERWATAARTAYLERCSVLGRTRERSGLETRLRAIGKLSGAALGRPTAVAISASAPEVRPTSFVIAVRIRALGAGEELTVDTAWVIRLIDPVTGDVHPIGDEIRDELIALERSAVHFN